MRLVADLAESIAGVIKASASPLGIFALMILVVGLLAWGFFAREPVVIKSWIFCAVVAFCFAMKVIFETSGSPTLLTDEQRQEELRTPFAKPPEEAYPTPAPEISAEEARFRAEVEKAFATPDRLSRPPNKRVLGEELGG
jgi:hypothetical protein